MFYKIDKPNIKDIDTKNIVRLLVGKKSKEVSDFIKLVNEPDYLCWDKIKYKKPKPTGIDVKELWLLTKMYRRSSGRTSEIQNVDSKPFEWQRLSWFDEFFNTIDLYLGGRLESPSLEGMLDKKDRQRFISRGIIEEAIASSQLEGAVTSRAVAKKMIKEGRKPINKSEQMILNNYRSMKALEDSYKDKEINLDLLLELHEIISHNTKDSNGDTPRLRNNKDKIYVMDEATGVIYHEAPNINFVKSELNKLFKFANNKIEDESFIHPVIKAIMIHFWIGYLHPFTDGNGRLARLLFYWYLIKHDYWGMAYLPISTIIKKSPSQYKMAFVYSEQDDNDLTYFIEYHIKKIKIAINEFKQYVKSQAGKNKEMSKLAKKEHDLNNRQISVLQYFRGDPDERTNLKMHMQVFQVSKATAIKDLKGLEAKGFLDSKKDGRYLYYYPSEKVGAVFKG
jgi:Fic family protein